MNDRAQLAVAEAELRARFNRRWMRRGVTMWDPQQTYLDAVRAPCSGRHAASRSDSGRQDHRGAGAVLGPSVHLVDCEVGPGARISHTVGSHAVVGEQCSVGPYVVLEKGTRLDAASGGPLFVPGASAGGLSMGAVLGPRLPPRALGPRPHPGARKGGESMEMTPKRRLELVSGKSPPWVGGGDRHLPGGHLERDQHPQSSPTARSTAASTSRSVARTCSSSRPTPGR